MNSRRPAEWQCPWCHNPIPHNTPYRAPLPVAEGWPSGTGQVVCGPGCPSKPAGAPVYRHESRGAF